MNNSVFDVIAMVVLGFVGYILRKYEFEEAPLILAYILGPMLETNFRQTLIISNGNLSVFVSRPISVVALIVAALLFISTGLSFYRKSVQKVVE